MYFFFQLLSSLIKITFHPNFIHYNIAEVPTGSQIQQDIEKIKVLSERGNTINKTLES